MNCKNKQAIFANKLDLSLFKYIKTLNDNRLGSIEIYQHKQMPDLHIMAKKKELNDQEKFIAELQKTQQRTELNHPNIIQTDKNMFEIRGFYEFPKWDLEREIKHRQNQNEYFSNQELKKIMYNIIDALIFLQNKNLVHGDLRPKYITYSPDIDIQSRLMDRLADSLSPDQLQIRNLKKKNYLYISPIMFETMINKEQYLKHDPYKSEMFSLGLILLQTGLLKSIQSIYDYEQKKINFNQLQMLIDQFKSRYENDKLIIESIVCLTQVQEQQRMNPKEFISYLNQHYTNKMSGSSSNLNKNSPQNQESQENSYEDSKIEIQKFQDRENYNSQEYINQQIDQQDSDENSLEEIPLYGSNEEFDMENNELINKNQNKNPKIDKSNQAQSNKEQINKHNENNSFSYQNDENLSQNQKNSNMNNIQQNAKDILNQKIRSTISKDLEESNQSVNQCQKCDFTKKQKDEQIEINDKNKNNKNTQQIQQQQLKYRKKSVFDQPDDEYFSCRTIKNDSKERIYIRKRKIKSGYSNRKNSVTRKTPPFNDNTIVEYKKVDNTLQRQYYHSPTSTKKQENRYNIDKHINNVLQKTYTQQQKNLGDTKEKIFILPSGPQPQIQIKCESNINKHIHHVIYKDKNFINQLYHFESFSFSFLLKALFIDNQTSFTIFNRLFYFFFCKNLKTIIIINIIRTKNNNVNKSLFAFPQFQDQNISCIISQLSPTSLKQNIYYLFYK